MTNKEKSNLNCLYPPFHDFGGFHVFVAFFLGGGEFGGGVNLDFFPVWCDIYSSPTTLAPVHPSMSPRGVSGSSLQTALSSPKKGDDFCCLVGGFNPLEKYWPNWIFSPGKGENKTRLKPVVKKKSFFRTPRNFRGKYSFMRVLICFSKQWGSQRFFPIRE